MIQDFVQIFLFQTQDELLSTYALPFFIGPKIGLVVLLSSLRPRGDESPPTRPPFKF
jgi:hypothetical protein